MGDGEHLDSVPKRDEKILEIDPNKSPTRTSGRRTRSFELTPFSLSFFSGCSMVGVVLAAMRLRRSLLAHHHLHRSVSVQSKSSRRLAS